MAPKPLRRLFRLALGRPAEEKDADAELDLHVELRAEELASQGVDPLEARRRAELLLGDRTRIRSQLRRLDRSSHRAERQRELLGRLRRDLALAVRSLRKDPWFTLGAGAIVALSVGLNAVTLSALDSAFVRPLPYPDAGRIVRVYETDGRGRRMQVAGMNAADWRRQSSTVERLAVYADAEAPLVDGRDPEYVHLAAVGQEMIQVLGVEPILGRWIAPDEASVGAAPVAVIREGLWRRRYAGRPDVIGKSVRLAGLAVTIVGVLPDAATFPNGTEAWVSAERSGDNESRTAHNWHAIARLRPSVPLAAARDELDALTRRLTSDRPAGDPFVARGADVISLRESILGSERLLLVVLQAAALLILAITAVNLTSLLLVRSARQRSEIAVRSALGAGRGDIVRRVVLEATVLTTGAGAIGLGLAAPFRGAVVALLRRFLPQLPEPAIDLRIVAATLLGSALVGAIAAAVPAFRSAGEDPNGVLGGAGTSRVTGHHPIMGGLIAAEVGLALTLVVGAGLLGRSLLRLAEMPAGFDPRGRVVVRIPAEVAVPTDSTPFETTVGRIDRLVEASRRIPGARRAAMALSVPLMDWSANASLEIEGLEAAPGAAPSADFRLVGPGYFALLGVGIRTGREFSLDDRPAALRVAVVNAAFARRYLVGRNPIGTRVRFDGMQQGPEPWATVVGVADDVRHHGLDAEPVPEVYLSYRQRPLQARDFSIVLETDPRSPAPIAALKAMLRSEAPTAPFRASSLEGAVSEALAAPRGRSVMLGVFALLALGLAGAGIFGVVAFTVAQRTREIGLRLALGSARGAATRTAMRQVLRPVLLGLALGVAGALLGTRLVRAFLFDTATGDPLVLAVAVATMGAVSLIASYLPARRAARIDPAIAIRES